jgi:hypothetical protein
MAINTTAGLAIEMRIAHRSSKVGDLPRNRAVVGFVD